MNEYTSKDQVKLVLVGNKTDLERKVKFEEGKKLADNEGMLFFETSAKTADGVVNMFYTSFSMIDFFDSIRMGNNDEKLIKELIDQNVIGKEKFQVNKEQQRNNIIKRFVYWYIFNNLNILIKYISMHLLRKGSQVFPWWF